MATYYNQRLFAERLKILMEERGETIYDLAAIVELNPSVISRYRNANSNPKMPTLQKIAEHYDVHPMWLAGGAGVTKHFSKLIWKRIPILGTIAAGKPITAQQNVVGYEQVPQHDKADFCLLVKGDSMSGARILDGDIVFIHQQPEVENGEIAAVLIDGEEATLKRFYKMDGVIILKAENPAYPDMIFSKKDAKSITIIGKATEFKSGVR